MLDKAGPYPREVKANRPFSADDSSQQAAYTSVPQLVGSYRISKNQCRDQQAHYHSDDDPSALGGQPLIAVPLASLGKPIGLQMLQIEDGLVLLAHLSGE